MVINGLEIASSEVGKRGAKKSYLRFKATDCTPETFSRGERKKRENRSQRSKKRVVSWSDPLNFFPQHSIQGAKMKLKVGIKVEKRRVDHEKWLFFPPLTKSERGHSVKEGGKKREDQVLLLYMEERRGFLGYFCLFLCPTSCTNFFFSPSHVWAEGRRKDQWIWAARKKRVKEPSVVYIELFYTSFFQST